MSEGILTLDANGRIESSNSAAHSMLGFSAVELDGLELLALLPMRERTQHESDFRCAFAGDDAEMSHLRSLETLGVRSDGTAMSRNLLNA